MCVWGGIQLLINTTLQLTIQYMLHWIEAKDLRGFLEGGGVLHIKIVLFLHFISNSYKQ